MAGELKLSWIAVGSLAVMASAARADEPATLPREIREVQRSLGGPAVDQFPSLQPMAAQPLVPSAAPAARPTRDAPPGVWPNWSSVAPARVTPAVAQRPDDRTQTQVNSLRETAAQLDGSANRLESLDLYEQADALRNVAQRLRMEARSMVAGVPTTWENPAVAPPWFERPDAPPRQGRGRAQERRERRERSVQPAPEPTPAEPSTEAAAR
jgi:hypothetical protein